MVAALDPRHVAIARDNLRHAFPDWDEARLDTTARGVYAHFGRMLFDAANFGDVQVLQAATLVAVCVAVVSQLLSDAAYVVLNPRIRLTCRP